MKNFWESRYANDDFAYGKMPNDFLAEQAHKIRPNSKILCLADGEGRNSVYLAKLGHQVTSVDFSEKGTEKLRKWAKEENLDIKVICEDLNNFEIKENTWDCIVSIFMHLPSPLRQNIHSNICKGLKHEGLFILESYTPDQLNLKTGGPSDIKLLLQLKDLKNEIAGLRIIIAEEIEREVFEGKFHNGMSSVVRFLGEKI